MTDTLFKEVHYSLGGLINDIGLPDIQRPFVARPVRLGYQKLAGTPV
jgi:hypothetical protein